MIVVTVLAHAFGDVLATIALGFALGYGVPMLIFQWWRYHRRPGPRNANLYWRAWWWIGYHGPYQLMWRWGRRGWISAPCWYGHWHCWMVLKRHRWTFFGYSRWPNHLKDCCERCGRLRDRRLPR